MQTKYLDGTKVRIKARDTGRQFIYRELEKYENMTGVVLSSKEVIGYILRPVVPEQLSTELATTLRMYKVKLDEGVTLDNLIEYCLEQL